MDHKPPEKPQEPSSVHFIQDDNEPFSPLPDFATRHTLDELLGTKYLATLELIRSIQKKNERS
ncbi:hypothetical protein SAMN05216510_4433 [Pseudomonas coleopterorum]|nr:hypothetical protein SAMN05216510_4433 [Pseudomonas coleopterorum]